MLNAVQQCDVGCLLRNETTGLSLELMVGNGSAWVREKVLKLIDVCQF